MKPARWLMAKTGVVMDLLITDLWRPTHRNGNETGGRCHDAVLYDSNIKVTPPRRLAPRKPRVTASQTKKRGR